MMHILVRGDIAAELGGKRIGFVVRHLRLDVEQTILADEPVAADAPVVDFLARRRRAEFGRMVGAVGWQAYPFFVLQSRRLVTLLPSRFRILKRMS